MAKRLWLTILLAVLIYGVGHIYLGFFNRGITILIVGIVASMVASILIPFPYNSIVIIGYWIWQIIDAYKHYKKLNVGQTQVS
ncbi:MAG TPA: hypothetical protein VJ772_06075 [Nitrososphaeraceae archaeon]|nr:hypothetical protein [Nitrososphaeraceae archaeon]